VFVAASVLGVGCKRPPPAPEGLDESARYVLREFYADDLTVGAGLTGFMDWFDADGVELLDQNASLDNVGAFSLGDLSWEDVGHLPLDEDGRDPANASGVVSVAEIRCDWTETEALYARSDQDAVFEGDYDFYERTYESSRAEFEDATASLDFPDVSEPIDAFQGSLGEVERALLLTRNDVTQSTAGITISTDLMLHLRHGVYEVQGEDTAVSMVFGFTPAAATGESGSSTLYQSYSVVINVDRGNGKTLRMFALWTELDTLLVGSDSALVLSAAVNKSQDAAERLSAVCEGEIDIPAENP
jgi:hypothetical protein